MFQNGQSHKNVDSPKLVDFSKKYKIKEIYFRMVSPDDPDYDIYRDSLLRYCGYANEVGEAFRAQEMNLKIKNFF